MLARCLGFVYVEFNDSSSVMHSTKSQKMAVITRECIFWFIGKKEESHLI